MHVYLGSDHGGYKMKEVLKEWLKEKEYKFTDLGCFSEESVDYPDFAREVAEKVFEEKSSRGVIICGTGIGVSMTANKVKGIRAALCTTEHMAKMAREHNSAQVICIGGRTTDDETAKKILEAFLGTEFSGDDRHKNRINKMMALDGI